LRSRHPGPLRAFYERIRSRRRMQIAVVATARKLAVLCWHLVIKREDYAFARPSLTDKKLRALKLRAGMPSRRGQKGKAAAYSLKEVRRRERELTEQGEQAYRQLVADWQAKTPKSKPSVAAANGTRLQKPLSGASCAAGISPRTCTPLRGRPRPRGSLTLPNTRPRTTPPRDDALARPNPPPEHPDSKIDATRGALRPAKRPTRPIHHPKTTQFPPSDP
jgi:hypothetical protein